MINRFKTEYIKGGKKRPFFGRKEASPDPSIIKRDPTGRLSTEIVPKISWKIGRYYGKEDT